MTFMGDEDDNRHKSKKCLDMHTFQTVEWEYGRYINGRFEPCVISEAETKRARMIACRHCTYIREIQYKD